MKKYVFIILTIFSAGILLSGCTWDLPFLNINEPETPNEEGATSKPLNVTFTDESQGGCADYFAYIGSTDGQYYLTVSGVKEDLESNSDFRIEDGKVNVVLTRYSPNISEVDGEFPYCNDVAPFKEGENFKAESGVVEIEKALINIPDSFFDSYKIDLYLKDLQFQVDGESVTIDQVEILDVTVGWYAG